MPAIRLFGRPSLAAGDDIRYILIPAVVFRFIQIVLSCVLLIRITDDVSQSTWNDRVEFCLQKDPDEADIDHPDAFASSYQLVVAYMVSSMAVALIGLAMYGWIFYTSKLGTPTNSAPRHLLPRLIEIDLTLLYALRVGTFIFGGVVLYLFAEYCRCNPDDLPHRRFLTDPNQDIGEYCWMYGTAWAACVIGLNMTQVIDVFFGIFAYLVVVWRALPFKPSSMLSAQTKWLCFCRCLLGCLTCLQCQCYCSWRALLRRLRLVQKTDSDGSADLSDFAGIFMNLFDTGNMIDVTATDFLAGVYVTRLLHFELAYAQRESLAYAQRESLAVASQSPTGGNHRTTRDFIDSFKDYEEAVIRLVQNKFSAADKGSDPEARFDGDGSAQRSERPSRVIALHDVVPSSDDSYPSFPLQAPNPPLNGSTNASGSMTAADQVMVDEHGHRQLGFEVLLDGPGTNRLSPKNAHERLCIAEGARYLDFADSIYIWSVADKDTHFLWRVFNRTRPKKRVRERGFTFSPGDHAGFATEVAPIAGIDEDDIVYANYEEGILATPFAIILDHEWKSVVIAIRGTLSVNDMVKDMMITPMEVREYGEKYGFQGEERYAHMGMLDSTEWIYKDCLRILEELMLGDDAKYKEYRLRIVGHSLGGGIAALLALFLRSKVPSVRAVAFEPPGCTVSENLADEVSDFVLSFVTGSDLIPRSSIPAVEEMRYTVLLNIARIKVSKYKVVDNSKVDLDGIDAVRAFLVEALYEPDEIPESNFIRQFVDFRRACMAKREQAIAEGKLDPNRSLFVPGRIIGVLSSPDQASELNKSTDSWWSCKRCYSHIAGGSATTGDGGGSRPAPRQEEPSPFQDDRCAVVAYWGERQQLQRILLSPTLLTDHKTVTSRANFLSLAETFGLTEPYSSALEAEGGA